jgi:hypothetical protein
MSSIVANNSKTSVKQPSAAVSKAAAAAYREELLARSVEDWCREGVSLCIPRVFANIGYKRIFGVFRRLGWGYVERVDTIRVTPKTGQPYKRAYVHYTPGRFNMRNSDALAALQHMVDGNDVQLEYEDNKPWFWKVSLSHARKPDEAPKPPKAPAVHLAAPRTQRRKVIDLDSTTTEEVVDAVVSPGNDPIRARIASNTH